MRTQAQREHQAAAGARFIATLAAWLTLYALGLILKGFEKI